ncbi:MAG: Calx-beta domain-containing protein [Panacagrimonas sp.]
MFSVLRIFAAVPIALFLLPAENALAAPARPLGGNRTVAEAASSDLIQSRVARDADGDFVVVWAGPGPGGQDIFARLFRSDGTPRGSAFPVTSATGLDESPDVAMNAAGDFVVVWEQATSDGGTGDGDSSGVSGLVFSAGGTPSKEGLFWVNDITASHQRDPVVAMDAQGNFAVAYSSFTVGDIKDDIFVRRFDTRGFARGPSVRVNDLRQDFQNHPAIAMSADGSFAVAWESDKVDRLDQSVRIRAYNADGSARGPEDGILAGTARQDSPAIAADPLGDFLLTWTQSGDDGSRFVLARGLTRPSGSPFPVLTLVNSITGNLGVPAVAGSARVLGAVVGDFVVAWEDRAPDSVAEQVFALRTNISGTERDGAPQVVFAQGKDDFRDIDIAADADGDFVVAASARLQAQEEADDIVARRFASAEIDLALKVRRDTAESGTPVPGSTQLFLARVENLQAEADVGGPPEIRREIGRALPVSLRGTINGTNGNGRLGRVGGPNWDCDTTPVAFECERKGGLSPEQTATLEIEVDAPDRETQISLRVRLEAGQVDPIKPEDNVQVLKTDIACRLRLSQNRFRVAENVGTRNVTINRLGSDNCASASVNIATTPGSAIAGADYQSKSGTLRWAADDQRPKTVVLRILDDLKDEPEETFDLVLSNPKGSKIDGAKRASVTILDNDSPSPPAAAVR